MASGSQADRFVRVELIKEENKTWLAGYFNLIGWTSLFSARCDVFKSIDLTWRGPITGYIHKFVILTLLMCHTYSTENCYRRQFFFILPLVGNSNCAHDDAVQNPPTISSPLETEHGSRKRKNLDISPIHRAPRKKSNQSDREEETSSTAQFSKMQKRCEECRLGKY